MMHLACRSLGPLAPHAHVAHALRAGGTSLPPRVISCSGSSRVSLSCVCRRQKHSATSGSMCGRAAQRVVAKVNIYIFSNLFYDWILR